MKNTKFKRYAFIFLTLIACNHKEIRTYDTEKDGYVPNAQTAISIAEAVWLPIYGEKVLNEKPYTATLVGDSAWVVEGKVYNGVGGAAYMEILKKDGKILKVTHFK